ncbi:uncharacterized protein LOC124455244 [Xenia sp. Carnegie-2017]|uniref:uncharacterized protein LOC124455244 n=1 Tax=Xenia sp. Carnegie-2017 TaxID=2897299 RepID=UPI001F03CB83|nr:uncharacterized protein LOC124455244 [Xenia sp. Carnegie-2017]
MDDMLRALKCEVELREEHRVQREQRERHGDPDKSSNGARRNDTKTASALLTKSGPGLWLSDVCKVNEELEVNVLVGADYLWSLQKGRIMRGKQGEPVAIETVLGWVVSGPVGNTDKNQPATAQAQEELGIIERVGKDSVINSHAKIHYMPHQAVVRKDAKTTKVRVVYDASAKVLKSSVSLNDCLHIGPSLNPLLFDILLRFREQRIALIADIEKAFLNIEVHERDRDSLSAIGIFRKTAKSFYVDDLASGESSTERAYQLYRKANERMNEGGFKLRKWRTNDSALRSQIEEDVRDVESSCVDEQTYAKTTLAQVQGQFGLLSPTIVKAKILFQDICYSGVDWDDTLPKSVKEVGEVVERSKGVVLNGNDVCVKLIASKTRVVPMKELSIPRLELMAARILAHLMSAVRKALESEYNFEGVKYWTDSMTVLYWIVNSGNWKQFVQHRVDEILRLSSKTEWSHYPGKENPADLGSRGVLMTELKNAEVWWSGPSWLRGSPRHYPMVKEIVPTVDSKVEEKRSFVVNLIISARSLFGIGNVISISK